MGVPAYPSDWASTWKGVQQGLKQAYTSARSRTRAVVLGSEPGGVVIDPGGGPGGAPVVYATPNAPVTTRPYVWVTGTQIVLNAGGGASLTLNSDGTVTHSGTGW